ncbi:MAG TPA: TetR/AcrR family transcriptional regulator [Thermoanaerobaculia bacterium]|nr:TetR/AcrR family transcriptional regulator [Thermoanaerobaculia bacterium]
MGTRERREREKAEVREKILDAARDLFANEGYEAVTMRKIAERIEYSPTVIYLYFKDKESVLHELCEIDFAALAQSFTSIAQISDPIERIYKAGFAYTEFALEHPNHYRLMFMTPHPPLDPTADGGEKVNPGEEAYAFLRGTVHAAMEAGRFRPTLDDPELIAQTLWAGLHGGVALQIAKANEGWIDWRPESRRMELMIDVLLRGLVQHED